MDVRELDRLVNRTELTPVNKAVLKKVREAVLRGKCDGPYLSRYTWEVRVEGAGAFQRVKFSLKKDAHGT